MAPPMILFLLTGGAPPILIITLIIMCYLAGYELYKEDLPFMWKAWWVLLIFLLNVVGFAIFWVWLLIRRNRTRPA